MTRDAASGFTVDRVEDLPAGTRESSVRCAPWGSSGSRKLHQVKKAKPTKHWSSLDFGLKSRISWLPQCRHETHRRLAVALDAATLGGPRG